MRKNPVCKSWFSDPQTFPINLTTKSDLIPYIKDLFSSINLGEEISTTTLVMIMICLCVRSPDNAKYINKLMRLDQDT